MAMNRKKINGKIDREMNQNKFADERKENELKDKQGNEPERK